MKDALYFDDMESLLDRSLGIKRKPSVDFRGNLSGNDLQDLFSKLYQQPVKRRVDLAVDIFALRILSAHSGFQIFPSRATDVVLPILNGNID